MPSDSPYADPDLLVAVGLVGFLVAVLTAFLPAALRLVAFPGLLGAGLLTAGLIGRQQDGLHRALFVGLAPAAGLTFALLVDHPYRFRALELYAAMGVTTGLLVGFFGYSAGTLEYWLAEQTPSPGGETSPGSWR